MRVLAWFAMTASFSRLPPIFEIGCDAGCPKAMVSGLGHNSGGGHAPLYHRVGIRQGEGGRGELAGAASNGAE